MRRGRRRKGMPYASVALANPFSWAMRIRNSSSSSFTGAGKCIASRVQKRRSSSGFSQTTGKSGGVGIKPCCCIMSLLLVFVRLVLGSLGGGGGVRARLGERGDRPALKQVQEISGEGRLDVHRPAHPLFELHREPRELRNLGPVQRRPPPQEPRHGHLPCPPGHGDRHPLLRPYPLLFHREVCLAPDPGVGCPRPRNDASPEAPTRRHDYLIAVPADRIRAEDHCRG